MDSNKFFIYALFVLIFFVLLSIIVIEIVGCKWGELFSTDFSILFTPGIKVIG